MSNVIEKLSAPSRKGRCHRCEKPIVAAITIQAREHEGNHKTHSRTRSFCETHLEETWDALMTSLTER